MSTERRARDVGASVAAEVRAEMGRQGLTLQGLSTRLGVNYWWVQRRLRLTSPAPISAGELPIIAEALGVPVAQLLPDLAAVAA